MTCTAPQVLVNGVCTTPAPSVTPANLQTSVPTPTYAASSDELAAFNEINAIRKLIGLGLLAQNTLLDKSANNHMKYVVANNPNNAHIEDPLKSGFTGVAPIDRASYMGYTGSVGELVGFGNGLDAVKGLMNTIYHRDILLDQTTEHVGISLLPTTTVPVADVEIGSIKGQRNASDFLTTYPFDGQKNLPLQMALETPSPFGIAYTDYATKTSSPVAFYSASGTALIVSSFTVSQGANLLTGRVLTSSNDTNGLTRKNAASWLGIAPFQPNTTYTASFTGTVNGVAVSRTWTFTTGTSAQLGGGSAQ
ncbi:CAP domain-containing protein [Undibacterium griseum]|uniref:CAP domain-containing protein n=1 Tax=Undibacterium griseum TaxID=2762295 RepID=A0ABR6YIF7_9BURK|nr:CAP domain-containing protein [Undibacterium griseum]MBC3883618.1 CAP domain-containing protein [Undibacterium griseum]